MFSLKDFEKEAAEKLPLQTWSFYSLGAEREDTMKDNENAFRRYTFVPRMLRNEKEVCCETTVLGEKISFPVGFAPSAYQAMAHPDGEKAAVRAAATMNTVYTLSTVSNTSVEDVAKAAPNGLLWMQLYMLEDRRKTVELIRRVEKSGYRALVLTVDCPVVGLHFRSWKAGFSLPAHLSLPNLPEGAHASLRKVHLQKGKEKSIFLESITWKDVSWLKGITELPIVLKGILTAEDAKLAVRYGAAAVWVSNHGGRQLDGTLATIDALKPIAEALDGSGCEVYIDGGFRYGTDVLKALALGAKAVFIGRPLLWGLAHNGEDGAYQILDILKKEVILAMKLSGCQSLSDVGPSLLCKLPKSVI